MFPGGGFNGLPVCGWMHFCLYPHQNIGCPWISHGNYPICIKGIFQGVIIADGSSCAKIQRNDYIERSAICQTTSHHRAFWNGISRAVLHPHIAACRHNYHMFPVGCFYSLSVSVYSSGHGFHGWPVHYQQITIYFSAYRIMGIPAFQVLVHEEETFVCEIYDLLPADTFIWNAKIGDS